MTGCHYGVSTMRNSYRQKSRLSCLRSLQACWTQLGTAIGLLLLVRTARADEQPQPTPTVEEGTPALAQHDAPLPGPVLRLADPPGFALGVEAYGGNAVLVSGDDNRAHLFGGGRLRMRYGYFLIGGAAEISDVHEERWQSAGGFAGAWLPCYQWVDLEASAGFSMRRLQNSDDRYGEGGYDVTLPALTLNLGLSDRYSEKLFGARTGFALVATVDLSRPHVAWQYPLHPGPTALISRGTLEPGGVTIGFAFSVGLELEVARPSGLRLRAEFARND